MGRPRKSKFYLRGLHLARRESSEAELSSERERLPWVRGLRVSGYWHAGDAASETPHAPHTFTLRFNRTLIPQTLPFPRPSPDLKPGRPEVWVWRETKGFLRLSPNLPNLPAVFFFDSGADNSCRDGPANAQGLGSGESL